MQPPEQPNLAIEDLVVFSPRFAMELSQLGNYTRAIVEDAIVQLVVDICNYARASAHGRLAEFLSENTDLLKLGSIISGNDTFNCTMHYGDVNIEFHLWRSAGCITIIGVSRVCHG